MNIIFVIQIFITVSFMSALYGSHIKAALQQKAKLHVAFYTTNAFIREWQQRGLYSFVDAFTTKVVPAHENRYCFVAS